MIDIVLARLKQSGRTTKFPDGPAPALPERFRGRPRIDASKCQAECAACAEACPTKAISKVGWAPPTTPQTVGDAHPTLTVDLGRCLFCTDCVNACPPKAITHDSDYRLSVSKRDDLKVNAEALKLATALNARLRRILGRSLKLRQVSAGGCNGCEADTNVLGTIGWDLGRFGIQFVASPRHADGILVTGPVTQNMRLALLKTYDAVPKPKIVIATGACAIAGGPYIDHSEANNGVTDLLPVDLFIPGCPPHPLTILDGLLRIVGRIA